MKYYLTLDIGGTDMKYGVINSNEELVFKSLRPTNASLGGSNIIKQIKEIYFELSKDYKLEGIAISSTGGIDETTQILTPSSSITDYDLINFREELKDLNLDVSAENDVNSMALCEKDLIPNKENLKSVVALTVGTGIGGAIIINNKVHKGHSFTAGEIGHMRINGELSFEALASTRALVQQSKVIEPSITNGVDVYKLYDSGNKEIIKLVNEFYDNLANGISNLIYIINPDHIVIGGGITNRGPKFLEELNFHLKPKLWGYLQDKFTISIAHHKNDAGMIGAFKNFKLTFDI